MEQNGLNVAFLRRIGPSLCPGFYWKQMAEKQIRLSTSLLASCSVSDYQPIHKFAFRASNNDVLWIRRFFKQYPTQQHKHHLGSSLARFGIRLMLQTLSRDCRRKS